MLDQNEECHWSRGRRGWEPAVGVKEAVGAWWETQNVLLARKVHVHQVFFFFSGRGHTPWCLGFTLGFVLRESLLTVHGIKPESATYGGRATSLGWKRLSSLGYWMFLEQGSKLTDHLFGLAVTSSWWRGRGGQS